MLLNSIRWYFGEVFFFFASISRIFIYSSLSSIFFWFWNYGDAGLIEVCEHSFPGLRRIGMSAEFLEFSVKISSETMWFWDCLFFLFVGSLLLIQSLSMPSIYLCFLCLNVLIVESYMCSGMNLPISSIFFNLFMSLWIKEIT